MLESEAESEESLNANQRAIVAYSQLLEAKLVDDPALKLQRFLDAAQGTQAQFRVARERAQMFADQMKARAAQLGLM